ncbi:hypothetical protein [Streptococcus parauberis]|uniref:hypothetical protein n=1 Tax=Streptococcus parauberis TaxID=1348 RepID=UPI000300025F|nr:hypothetical protein [Streptococcus parauberis]QBX27374.1 hypothetical protein Javan384_0039 [Streptococcus phage Javan384]UWM90534.1 hypothetical protein N2A94_08515 [Streptococcus parauberis]UWM91263.1 hypothetical protein N2A94_01160 [Streptococcus parauberis]
MKFLEVEGMYINVDKIISIYKKNDIKNGGKYTVIQCESQGYFHTETSVENIIARIAELTGNGG